MDKAEIRKVLEALAYSLNVTLPKQKDMIVKRVIVEDFIASLNRKGIISNDEYTNFRDTALALLETLRKK